MSNSVTLDDEGGQYEVDIQGYVPTLVDCQIQVVYGEWVHVNNGHHLTRGIADDIRWHIWWRDITVLPLCWCDSPGRECGPSPFPHAGYGEVQSLRAPLES